MVSYAKINRTLYATAAGPDGLYLNGDYYKVKKNP
jgi:hypothetical protein